jgi:3-oxoacyl-[acyl-carrier protein] reductase
MGNLEIDLTGRSAVITGGSSGIGLAIAQQYSAAGADVAILARRSDVLEEASRSISANAGGKVVAVQCDMASAEQISAAYRQVMQAFGKIDIVVNNAGGGRRASLVEITDELWNLDIDIKLLGVVRLARLVWPQMQERGWGRFLSILAISAKAPAAGSAPTSVTRAAGLALMKVMAQEGAPHGILANALLIASISSSRRNREAGQAGLTLEQHIEERKRLPPLGRMGEPEEAAALACFLASDRAGYITGTAINVDGGMSPVT